MPASDSQRGPGPASANVPKVGTFWKIETLRPLSARYEGFFMPDLATPTDSDRMCREERAGGMEGQVSQSTLH